MFRVKVPTFLFLIFGLIAATYAQDSEGIYYADIDTDWLNQTFDHCQIIEAYGNVDFRNVGITAIDRDGLRFNLQLINGSPYGLVYEIRYNISSEADSSEIDDFLRWYNADPGMFLRWSRWPANQGPDYVLAKHVHLIGAPRNITHEELKGVYREIKQEISDAFIPDCHRFNYGSLFERCESPFVAIPLDEFEKRYSAYQPKPWNITIMCP